MKNKETMLHKSMISNYIMVLLPSHHLQPEAYGNQLRYVFE